MVMLSLSQNSGGGLGERLWLESEMGVGSIFSLILPVTKSSNEGEG